MTRCHETEVEHRAHNPKVAGSNPAPATTRKPMHRLGFLLCRDLSTHPRLDQG